MCISVCLRLLLALVVVNVIKVDIFCVQHNITSNVSKHFLNLRNHGTLNVNCSNTFEG